MNNRLPEYPLICRIPCTLLFVFALTAVLSSCVRTPDMSRKMGLHRETHIIVANRPSVASCVFQKVKEFTDPELRTVLGNQESVLVKSGDFTVSVYDFEDAVGGTMVTLYPSSYFYIKKDRAVIDQCREKLESLKAKT